MTTAYSPVAPLKALVRGEPRLMMPAASTTATFDLGAAGQMTARWNGIPSCKPPPGFFVST